LETNLVMLTLRRTGANLLFSADAVSNGPRGFVMQGVQPQRLRFEHDALKALERAEIGSWSAFPPDGVQATVSRDQLRRMGFRGNY
jgi:hypothetical protein